jgi:hypothetical protein
MSKNKPKARPKKQVDKKEMRRLRKAAGSGHS